MDGVDPEATRALVEERMSWARGKLVRYERVRERLLDDRTEEHYLAQAELIGPYLTLVGGITPRNGHHPLVRARSCHSETPRSLS